MFDGVWNGDYKDIREFVATKLPVIEGFVDYHLNIRWKHHV